MKKKLLNVSIFVKTWDLSIPQAIPQHLLSRRGKKLMALDAHDFHQKFKACSVIDTIHAYEDDKTYCLLARTHVCLPS